MEVMKKAQIFLRVLRQNGMAAVFRRVHKSQRLRWYRRRGQKLNCRFGWRSQRPILVIESDDWGAEHIPGPKALAAIKAVDGFPAESVSNFDSLETAEDVERLCDVLNSCEDGDKKPAVITANFVMANPDYSAIRENDFRVFKPKLIDEGWNHEADGQALWREYRAGIENNLIVPQLHGIVHFCPDEWLQRLRQADAVSLKAFDWKMIGEHEDAAGIGIQSMAPIYHADAKVIKQLVNDGAQAFKRIFGMDSITTIAPCYGWRSPETEQAFLAHNIRVMQSREYQHLPGGNVKLHYTGERGPGGMLYLVRNCMLEPISAGTTVEQCISQIVWAFEHNFPAILCSHRINYTSRVATEVRDKGLAVLNSVLKQVKEKYSDVEFLSSDELVLKILSGKQTDSFV